MSDISIIERRDGEDRREIRPARSALAPFSNGKGEWLRWILSLILAALVAYATVSARISAIEATAEARHDEIKRFMDRIDRFIQAESRR